jgi:beta-phosphoglucomutase
MNTEHETLIKAVLFDLDGVIVFTDRYHYLGWKRLADENGWAFDEEVNNGCRGVPRMESLEVILRHNGVELPDAEKEELASKKNAYYVELLSDINEADVYPGAVDFLKRLRSTGVKIALCSSSKNAPLVLESLGLEAYFDAVVTGADIQKAKPDPEIFLLGASRVGVEPGKCVVFEDAPSGVAGALAAGMKCVGVGSPELLTEAPVTIEDYQSIDISLLLRTGLLPEPASF